MKSENGMSYIMLIICIIVIIAVAVGAVLYVRGRIEEEKLETIRTDMLAIQAKIKMISEEVTMKKEGISYIGKNIGEDIENEKIKELIQNNIIVDEEEKYDKYYLLEEENIKELGLTNYSIKEVIVDYETCEIIYIEGLEIDGETYYKLSDLNQIDLKKTSKDNKQIEENIENQESQESQETQNLSDEQ